MASFKDGVMGNSTKPLSNNFIDIGKKPKNPKKETYRKNLFRRFICWCWCFLLKWCFKQCKKQYGGYK